MSVDLSRTQNNKFLCLFSLSVLITMCDVLSKPRILRTLQFVYSFAQNHKYYQPILPIRRSDVLRLTLTVCSVYI